jgi:hypothetical protein
VLLLGRLAAGAEGGAGAKAAPAAPPGGGRAASATPRVVPVREGSAACRVRPEGGGTLLVVASALARDGGPFPVSLRAEPADGVDDLPAWREPVAGPAFDPGPPPVVAPAGPAPALAPAPPPSSRVFWLPVRPGAPADASRFVPIRAGLAATGRRVQVYVDARDRDRVDPALPALAVATFDGEVWPAAAARWGTAHDVDGDGRFTVLLTSWLGRLRRDGEPVAGCFRGADLDPALEPPFGNRCDLVTLDAGLGPGPYFQSVLIHEYAHAVLFSRRVLGGAGGAAAAGEDEAGWLDEGIAHLVEDEHGASLPNLGGRLAAYRAAPSAFGLVLPDADDGAALSLAGDGHRGAAALFLRHCAARTGRVELLRRLARPGARGVANVERAAGVPFDDLYRGWSVAQFVAPGAPRPAAEVVPVGGPPRRRLVAPTATAYALVVPPDDRPVRIVVDAPREAALQVTVVPLAAAP